MPDRAGEFDRPSADVTGRDQRSHVPMSDPAAFWQAAPDGPNAIADAQKPHLLLDLLRRLANPLVAILLVAAAIAGVTGDVASFAIIVVVVILSTALDMVQEHRAEATADALNCAPRHRPARRTGGGAARRRHCGRRRHPAGCR